MLIGREKEFEYLDGLYRRDDAEAIIIYSPELYGKTSLIKDFSADKQTWYFTCLDIPEEFQFEIMANQFQYFIQSNDVSVDYAAVSQKKNADMWNWNKLLALLSQIESSEKTVFVIDDFEKISKNYLEHLNSFCEAWTSRLCYKNVMFIICINDPLLDDLKLHSNPFITKNSLDSYSIRLINLNPLSYDTVITSQEIATATKQLEDYILTDGVPGIRANIFNAELQLSKYVRECTVYNYILWNLSSGAKKLSELYELTGISRSKLNIYLDKLIKLKFIDKINALAPLKKTTSSYGVYYRISNAYTEYWYRFEFMRSNINAIQLDESIDYSIAIRRFFENRLDSVLEAYLNKRKNSFISFKIAAKGYLLGKNNRTYLVFTDRDNKKHMICDVKFSDEPYKRADYNYFIKQTAFYSDKKVSYFVFSKSGYEQDMQTICEEKNVILTSIRDFMS